MPPTPLGPLPPNPRLEQCRKQAKELVKAHRADDPEAVARIKQHLPQLSGATESQIRSADFRLSDAQLIIAREYGFPSWPKLKRYIESVSGAGAARCRPFIKEMPYYEDRAYGLLSAYQTGQKRAFQIIKEFHPRFANASEAEIRTADFTLEDAKLVFAREHGFDTWRQFRRHIEALARGETVEPFMLAFEAIQAGDLASLKTRVDREPTLVNARGTNGNTLLNLAVSCKQPTIVRFLIDAGADVDLANNKGWTPLHQAAYSNQSDMVDMLLEAGASVEAMAHGDGGTPLVQALFWGHHAMAERLAERGIVPNNLRVAAGLGRLDLVKSFFEADGSLKPNAGAHREFHRPHSGFPPWNPSDDPQEIIDEAFVYACKNGQAGVLGFLLERGADINGDPYRGTGLLWAAWNGHLGVVRWLLDHGAELNRKATFGGPQHGVGVTALHLAAQTGNLSMVKFLVEHGADPNIEDDLYHSPPSGWANHFGHTEIRDYLLERASSTITPVEEASG